MKKLLKQTTVVALLLLICISATHAAFPTLKQTNNTATVANTEVTAGEKAVNAKQLKREAKAAMAAKGKYYAGSKKKMLAAIFAITLGYVGVHSFYMGQTVKGIVQAGAFALGLVLYVVGIAATITTAGTADTVSGLAIAGLLIIIGVEVWAVIDFVRILTGKLEPEEGFDE